MAPCSAWWMAGSLSAMAVGARVRRGAKGRALCDKESQRWIDGLRASGRLAAAGAARVTAVADREGDIYEMFADRPEGVEVLVRAAQDRAVPEGAGKLFSSLADRPEKEHAIELPARPGQRKREARIAVRFGAVTLQRPKNRPVAPGVAARQPVFLVEAQEIDPPPVVNFNWKIFPFELSDGGSLRLPVKLFE